MCKMHHGGLWMIITLMVRSNTLFLNTLIIKWSIVILWKISVFSVIHFMKYKKKKSVRTKTLTLSVLGFTSRSLCLCVTEKLMDRANLIPCDTKGALELPAVQETALLLSVFQRPLWPHVVVHTRFCKNFTDYVTKTTSVQPKRRSGSVDWSCLESMRKGAW